MQSKQLHDGPEERQSEQVEQDIAVPRFRQRLKSGGSVRFGSIQVIIGIAIIWTIFGLLHDSFLTTANLMNLSLQVVSVALISLGVVIVLLVGQIDLSVGSVAGATAALFVVLNINQGIASWLSVLLALCGGAAIGLLHGVIQTTFKVPGLIVTLAGMITWQGLQIYLLGSTGAVNITDSFVLSLTHTFFAPAVGWSLLVAVLLALIVTSIRERLRRQRLSLELKSVSGEVLKVGLIATVGAAVLFVFTADRGVPLSVLILLAAVVGVDFILRRTVFGRRLFAVGGNEEAASRFGINVKVVVTVTFVCAGLFASLGGIMGVSRLMAVNQAFGSEELLMNAIAGAVIGGTSLFGGRGSAWSALLGGLVIGSVQNGMNLLALNSAVKLMVTGAVLVIAVVVDSMTRKQAT